MMSRIAGMSLIVLGLACWPEDDGSSGGNGALQGMLTYSLLATLYLGYLRIVVNGSGYFCGRQSRFMLF